MQRWKESDRTQKCAPLNQFLLFAVHPHMHASQGASTCHPGAQQHRQDHVWQGNLCNRSCSYSQAMQPAFTTTSQEKSAHGQCSIISELLLATHTHPLIRKWFLMYFRWPFIYSCILYAVFARTYEWKRRSFQYSSAESVAGVEVYRVSTFLVAAVCLLWHHVVNISKWYHMVLPAFLILGEHIAGTLLMPGAQWRHRLTCASTMSG